MRVGWVQEVRHIVGGSVAEYCRMCPWALPHTFLLLSGLVFVLLNEDT